MSDATDRAGKILCEHVRKFADLEHDWDSYGAGPIDVRTIEAMCRIFESIHVGPTVNNGVYFEFHDLGIDVEFEIDPQDGAKFLYCNEHSGEEIEKVFSVLLPDVPTEETK